MHATGDAYPPVAVEGSQLRVVRSAEAGRDYAIQIMLPPGYDTAPSRHFPLLLVLDGQWDFKLLASVQGGLFYDKYVPEMIIVGVTYPGKKPDYDALRAIDLTPVEVQRLAGSGNGPKFLAFIENELLPRLSRDYRVDESKRVLLGSSLGGLFALYAMFERPSLFTDYITSSPAVTYANRWLFGVEMAFAASHPSLRGRLYVGVGAEENLAAPVEEFVETLKSRKYDGLQIASELVPGEGHASNKPQTYNRGLRYVFGGKP